MDVFLCEVWDLNRYSKLLNNSIIFALGNLGSKLVVILLVPLYTFYLTAQDYGVVDLISSTQASNDAFYNFNYRTGTITLYN